MSPPSSGDPNSAELSRDTAAARTHLADSLDTSIRGLPPDLAAVARTLVKRIDLGSGDSTDWAGRFSELTLLYPFLHGRFAERSRVGLLDNCNLAHAWLIIHTFIEDRLRDRQLRSGPADISFSAYCLSEGLLQLHDAGVLTDAPRDAVRATMRRYYACVDMPYLGNETTGIFDLTPERAIEIASGRAAFGWITTEAMLFSVGVAANTIAELARAFDLTVTGMQWVDDISDWHEDITTRDDNLLLIGLAHRYGLNAYELDASEVRAPNIAHALLSRNVFAWAEEQARDCFSSARDIFDRHALGQLVDLMGKRITAAQNVRAREEMVCSELVKTALALFKPGS